MWVQITRKFCVLLWQCEAPCDHRHGVRARKEERWLIERRSSDGVIRLIHQALTSWNQCLWFSALTCQAGPIGPAIGCDLNAGRTTLHKCSGIARAVAFRRNE